MDEKDSRFAYTKDQKEINRALKMQEMELAKLSSDTGKLNHFISEHEEQLYNNRNDINDLTEQVERLKKAAMDLAIQQGINLPPMRKSLDKLKNVIPQTEIEQEEYLVDKSISKSNIPSWEEVMHKTNEMVQDEIILENLLSSEEFQYCINDIKRINNEFASKTKLSRVDISFLLVATALQTVRWIILNRLLGDIGESIDGSSRMDHNDKSIKEKITERNKWFQSKNSEHGHSESAKGYKSWEQIVFSSAPYDTTVGSPLFNENLGGKYHRYRTFGHDPVLGWIFGTANFITDTITLTNFNSYNISRDGGPHFDTPTDFLTIFMNSIDSIMEDYLRLPAALFAQFVHLESDAFTKLGLPVPILEAFSESMAGKLYKSQYDSLCLVKDMAIVGSQAVLSILINMIISVIHGFFYDEKRDGLREHYEVRTRKILLYSNILASSGNIIYLIGTEDIGKLDAGGLLVTISRLFSDNRFITKIKIDFINKELDKITQEELADLDSMFEK